MCKYRGALALLLAIAFVHCDSLNALKLNLSTSCDANQIYFCTLSNITATYDDPLVVANVSAPQLSELVLRNSVILRLPHEIFTQAPNLRSFFMHNCALNRLNGDDFRAAHQLRKLVLQKNRLSDVPEKVFGAAFALEELQLGHNTIHMLHVGAFAGLARLKYLDLQQNNIRRLPERVFAELLQLEHIDLSSNDLEKIDAHIFATNKRLQTVLLANNKFTVFESNALAHLPHLHLLDLSGSALDELNLQSVDTLLVQNTALKRCTLSGGTIKLHAGNNQLTELSIGDKLAVRELELHGNLFDSLDSFAGMLNLQRLDLSRNQLKMLRTSRSPLYVPLPSLLTLNVASNQLQNLSADNFLLLQKLTHLDVAFNHMLCLDERVFEPLYNLEKFYIEGNRLHAFDYEHFTHAHNFLKEFGIHENEWEHRYLSKMMAYLLEHKVQLPVRFSSASVLNLHESGSQLHASASAPAAAKLAHQRYAATGSEDVKDVRMPQDPSGVGGIHPYWTSHDIMAMATLCVVLFILLLQFINILREEQCFSACAAWARARRGGSAAVRDRQRLDEEDSEV